MREGKERGAADDHAINVRALMSNYLANDSVRCGWSECYVLRWRGPPETDASRFRDGVRPK
jgi:hypothetical protein